ncbi:MAG: hypothetical protein ACRBEE_12900 [Arenicella sp.]
MKDNADFSAVFKGLKSILEPYSKELVVVHDDVDHFYLNTHFLMKNKKPMYFGSVKINKNYVSFHLMPVYVFPELLNDISSKLKRRMQGKSCFNFRVLDDNLFKELGELTRDGYSEYKKVGYLS